MADAKGTELRGEQVTYTKVPGKPFQFLRSDGVMVQAVSNEVKEARRDGRAPPVNEAAAAKRKGRSTAGKAATDATAPKPAKPPPMEDDDRPKKLTKREQAAEFGILAGMFFGGFALASQRPHWALSPAEQSDLGAALAGALPTLPQKTLQKIQKASPWIRLAMVGSNIVIPRMAADARINSARPATAPIAPPPPARSASVSAADLVFSERPAQEAAVASNGSIIGRSPVRHEGDTPGPIHVAEPPA